MSKVGFAMQDQGGASGPLHRPVCRFLKAHQAAMAAVHMRDLFGAEDPLGKNVGGL